MKYIYIYIYIYIYCYWPKCAKVGFSGCVARGSAPPIKTALPKGVSMGPYPPATPHHIMKAFWGGPFGMALFNGATDRGAKKSTRKPNFGTFGPIIIYILSQNIKPQTQM